MQDRYAGDVGDFVKLGLLRAIAPNHRLGVAWYRFTDEAHTNDGRHTGYLADTKRYRHLDPELFDHLRDVVVGSRTIASLLPMLPTAISAHESVDMAHVHHHQRRDWRRDWFAGVQTQLVNCDVVFADPDNGIVDDVDTRKGTLTYGKQIPLAEALSLAEGRCAVIYHHNTRRAGGHDAEVDHWLAQIDRPALAVRAKAYSPRTFFAINPTPEIERRIHAFCARWEALKVSIHGN
jgi:hypothetical protein